MLDARVRIYVELKKLGVNLGCLDIGGGLGVDYDGSKSSYFSSVNYSLEEHASDIVYQIKNICDGAGIETIWRRRSSWCVSPLKRAANFWS